MGWRSAQVLIDIVCLADEIPGALPDIQKHYWKGVLWLPTYSTSSCGGAPISIVRQYIEQQQTPH